jgi:CheY-like chemotaxis protein
VAEGQDRRTALLVEDEVLVTMVAEENLRAIGFEPVCVMTAADALAALAEHANLALAIIDVGLPDMRGDDLAAQARETAPGLPIVLATGYDSTVLGQRFAGDSRLVILGKPYSENDLRQAIASLGVTF